MALRARYLADTSALARLPLPPVAARLGPLLEEGLAATCAIVDLEVLYSARSPDDYETLHEERLALEDIPITPAVTRRAMEIQRALARHSQHRVPIPGLLVAAAAEAGGVTVLHYDADFERIAAVSGQAQEWIVPRGSV